VHSPKTGVIPHEKENIMIIKTAELETVCGITSKLPKNTLPEVAFAGKSNVGKSSLINTLLNRKALARTSGQPGKTQTINFYNINKELYFVDLPGYGYAKVPKEVAAKWGPMIERYLHTSSQLRMVFLLIDIRHKPTANDVQMYRWILSNGFSPVIIATKMDKLKRSQIKKTAAADRPDFKGGRGSAYDSLLCRYKTGKRRYMGSDYESLSRRSSLII
jgi:GTP-binding protein